MGRAKEHMMDEEYSRYHQKIIGKIADYFGLTKEETEAAEPEWEEEMSNDDAHIGWVINFSQNTKEETLEKLEGQHSHNVDLHFFDDPDDRFQDEEPPHDGDGFLDISSEEAMRIARSVDKNDEDKQN